MRARVLSLTVLALSVAALGQDCTSKDFAAFSDVQITVLRLLSSPGYTSIDEKTLNEAGDLAAVAIMRTVSIEVMGTPQNRRQILLILRFAFEAPNLIAGCNRKPTATLLLIDHLQASENGLQDNELNSTRFLVEHNSTKGQPLAPGGESHIDWEHTKWVDSILRWTVFIKPGMTRKDVLGLFTTEGGLSNRRHRTYVLKQCPYIKVDLEFEPVGDAKNILAESPDDKIITISNPYLQYGIMD